MLKSLCMMRLNTAGVVVGWFGLVGSFVATIGLAALLGYADVLAKSIVDSMEHAKENAYSEIHMALVVGASIYLAIVLLNLLASGMLILGTMKERHLMLLPWLINSGMNIVFVIIYTLAGFIALISSSMYGPYVPSFVFTVLVLAIQIYIFYGIYSLYKQIQLTRDQQRPLIQPQAVAVPQQTNTYPNYTKM